jgi:hypothetical protein
VEVKNDNSVQVEKRADYDDYEYWFVISCSGKHIFPTILDQYKVWIGRRQTTK